eukprot:289025_1
MAVELTFEEKKIEEELETKHDIQDGPNQNAMEQALTQFPTYDENKSASTDLNKGASLEHAHEILLNDDATLGGVTKAQTRLNYTQHSATLTWQNVSCGNYINTALFPVCGFIKPGQMLCILGGGDDSGIDHLFRILRDPTHIYKTKDKYDYIVQGNILLNSLPPGKFYKRTVAFVPKKDNHLATLKVGETLLFSACMRSPAHMKHEHIVQAVNTVLKWLGLTEEHSDTFVGDANLKGISGGQKRRLSIGVEVVAGASILIAELPTNGLDANTAFEVVNACKHIAQSGNKSMIMSLAQPSPQLFHLFHTCCLMAQGECFYFGPQNDVQSYLQNECKLIKPQNKSLTAWIEELTVKPTKFMSAELREIIQKTQKQKSKFVVTDRQIILYLSRKYRNSKYFETVAHECLRKHMDDLMDFGHTNVSQNNCKPMLLYDESYDLRGLEHGYGAWKLPKLISPMIQIKYICQRQFLATSRNYLYIFARLFQSILVGLSLGIVFFQLPVAQDQMRSRVGALFFMLGYMGFGAVPFIPALAKQLTVFYHQKNNHYFKTYSFYIAQILTELPFTAIDVFIFSILAYWMIGLFASFKCYIIFYIFMFLCRIVSWSFCMSVTGLFGNASIAQSLSTVYLATMYAYCGYLVPSTNPQALSIVIIIASISFFTFPFQYLVRSEFTNIIKQFNAYDNNGNFIQGYNDISDAAADTLTKYGIKTNDLTANDFIVVFFITFAWFIFFNILAYICLNSIDYSIKLIKPKDRNPWNICDCILDVFCCGICSKQRHERKIKDVKKRIDQVNLKHKYKSVSNADDTEIDTNTVININPVYLEFNNLSYSVDIKDKTTNEMRELLLLQNISGYVLPGEVIALMGPSGAGKSTLLDVLANKKNVGTISGDIIINGIKMSRYNPYYSRCFGYVEQFDSLMKCLTVEETIRFSAYLRLDSDKYTNIMKNKLIKKVMKQLEISNLANRRIGGDLGISQEARKKVSIAVELVSAPGLLFLDEPTTGLDGGAAFAVMNTVRSLADDDKCSVICTIHQPSAEVFQLFDKILLLQAGGKMVYFDNINKLCKYYAAHSFGTISNNKNPADFAIEAIENAMNKIPSPNEIWIKSNEYKEILNNLKDKPWKKK